MCICVLTSLIRSRDLSGLELGETVLFRLGNITEVTPDTVRLQGAVDLRAGPVLLRFCVAARFVDVLEAPIARG